MNRMRLSVVAMCAAVLALFGCGKEPPAADAAKAKASPPKVVEEKPAPYAYPAPVKGRYKEVNLGEFDVVDGLAYPAAGGGGTVVYVTEKPIASPMIAGSACPATEARAIAQMRDARYLEVTLDPSGHSSYFLGAKSFGGGGREAGSGRSWSGQIAQDGGHAKGKVVHKLYGSFDFDLPLSGAKQWEPTENDRFDSKRGDPAAAKPAEQALRSAYQALHDAAAKKNLKALLTAQGFDAKQVAAIRGLDGIDADFAVYADRFLSPGTADDFSARPGSGYVRAEGTNAKGKKFANYYWFSPCGDRLVLTMIAENPQ